MLVKDKDNVGYSAIPNVPGKIRDILDKKAYLISTEI
jgi:hypothetical protein